MSSGPDSTSTVAMNDIPVPGPSRRRGRVTRLRRPPRHRWHLDRAGHASRLRHQLTARPALQLAGHISSRRNVEREHRLPGRTHVRARHLGLPRRAYVRTADGCADIFDTPGNLPGTPGFNPTLPIVPPFFAGWATVSHTITLTGPDHITSTGTNAFFKFDSASPDRTGCSTAAGQRFE